MAKKKVETSVDNEVKNELPDMNEMLALMKQMKETMAAQAAEIEKLKSENNTPVNNLAEDKPRKDRPKYVNITSLVNATLILVGSQSHWIDPHQTVRVSAKEAIKIVDNNMLGLEQGMYTVDQWLIDDNDWDVNESVKSHDDISNFFNLTVDQAVDMFNNMTSYQRGDIVEAIESKIHVDGKFDRIDIANAIGNIVGKNFIKMMSDFSVD